MLSQRNRYTNEQIQYLLNRYLEVEKAEANAQIDAAWKNGAVLTAHLRESLKAGLPIIQAVNLDNSHWVALYIDPTDPVKIWYIDALFPDKVSINKNVLQSLKDIFGEDVKIDCLEKQLQADNYSCGAWTVEILSKLASTNPNSLNELTAEDLNDFRPLQISILRELEESKVGRNADDDSNDGIGEEALEDEDEDEDEGDEISHGLVPKRSQTKGEPPSDDSDSEEERGFLRQEKRYQDDISHRARKRAKRSQISKVIISKKRRKELTAAKQGPKYNCYERAKIKRGPGKIPDEVQRDLSHMSSFASRQASEPLTKEVTDKLGTKFYVPVCRGFHYAKGQWSKQTRLAHRGLKEIGQPIYSRALLDTFPADATVEYKNRAAIFRHDCMLRLHDMGETRGFKEVGDKKDSSEYIFSNAAFAVEDLYVKKYSGFHKTLSAWQEHFRPGAADLYKRINCAEGVIALHVDANSNFNISGSFVPHHAVEYAYGEKIYSFRKDLLARPRWDSEGKVIRKHIGKIYLMLFEPYELTELGILDVAALDEGGIVHIPIEIVHETEATCPVYIPQDHVVYTAIAEFPSFDGEHKQIYLSKYGLAEEAYNLFRDYILSGNAKKVELAEERLRQHLCSYMEVCLVDQALKEAEKKEGVLIYPNGVGGYALLPPKVRSDHHVSSPKAKRAATARNEQRQALRQARKDVDRLLEGFLPALLNNFNVMVLPTKHKDDLLEILAVAAKLSKDDLMRVDAQRRGEFSYQLPAHLFCKLPHEIVVQALQENLHKLNVFANVGNLQFTIHSPNFKDGSRLVIGNSEQNCNIYYIGGDSFALLVTKGAEPNIDLSAIAQLAHKLDEDELGLGAEDLDRGLQGGANVGVDFASAPVIKAPLQRDGVSRERHGQKRRASAHSPQATKQAKITRFFEKSRQAPQVADELQDTQPMLAAEDSVRSPGPI